MDIFERQKCKICNGNFSIKSILDLAECYWAELDVLICKSPCCDSNEELMLSDGQIERGYVYAAGAPHFAGMEQYNVVGLTVVKDSKSLIYTLDGLNVTINVKP